MILKSYLNHLIKTNEIIESQILNAGILSIEAYSYESDYYYEKQDLQYF